MLSFSTGVPITTTKITKDFLDWLYILVLGPYEYIHVLDKNSNVTRLEQGPQVFVRKDHELVTGAREKFIIIPPRHYCIIENPVERNEVTVDDGPPQAKRVKSSSSMVLLLLIVLLLSLLRLTRDPS